MPEQGKVPNVQHPADREPFFFREFHLCSLPVHKALQFCVQIVMRVYLRVGSQKKALHRMFL